MSPSPTSTPTQVLVPGTRVPVHEWQTLRERHEAAVDALTEPHLRRRRHGVAHPIVDFLFTYYRSSVGQLRAWHPGLGVALEAPRGAAEPPRFYRRIDGDGSEHWEVDLAGVRAAKGKRWPRAALLLQRTRARAPRFGCFGLHEWAMLYRLDPEAVRHSQVPLRVSPDEIAEQVESGVRCTHFDAFRFFTPDSEKFNERRLRRDDQLDHEQPGCLHAGMDLYRWACELGPACPADLKLATFEAAVDARIVDMQASPYDLRDYGYPPIPVETAEGRSRYVAFQRRWATRTDALRERLLAVYAQAGVGPLEE